MADVTRYMPLREVTNPASASVSVSVKPTHPREVNVYGDRETPTPPGNPRLTAADWDALLEERIGIMVESGAIESLAKARAHVDTLRMHGPRPAGTAPTSRETAPGGTGVAERHRNAAERNFGRRTA